MLTVRNLGGVALFLFGTTFLWLTPSFASRGISTKSFAWSAANVLALTTTAGLTVATWGLFNRVDWWEVAAVGSSALGVIAALVYWAAARAAGEQPATFNALIHILGSAGVFALLLIPSLERWVSRHVMGGS